MTGRRIAIAIAGLLAASAGATYVARDAGGPGAGADWAAHGGTADESGYSRLDQVNAGNVARLGLAWSMDLDGEVTLEATPLAVDGVLYFTGSYSAVYAVDAATGKLKWKHDPEIWSYNPIKMNMNFGANRGVAYADGVIYAPVLDGRLQALDAKTGKVIWSVDTVPAMSVHTLNSAPRVMGDKVIVGNAGADANMRGYVTAYDRRTGKQAWRFYTVPGKPGEDTDPALVAAAKTWGTEHWKAGGGGGTVWNGITFDPELNRVYIGVGNGGPYNPKVRDPGGNGDNLYLTSIVALDADTGKYIWYYQINPRDAWDYKATANMVAATLTIDGKPRKVLMQAPTNGFFYVIDRETGKLISAEKTGKVTWASHIDLKTGRPVELPNIRYETGETIIYPSMIGSHNWQDMSFNPRSGLVYIPYQQLGALFTTKPKPGEFVFGGVTPRAYLGGPEDGHGALLAWDPVKQRAAWKAPISTIWNGGTLSTAGNLVFQGAGDGWLSAYDAASGKKLWRFNAGLGIVAPPISYAVKGRQYVSVLVGYGGTTSALSDVLNVGWKYGAQPRRLLTFALGGKARLAPSPPADLTVHAVDDPALTLPPADVAAGQGIAVMCLACHGPGFRSAGSPGPDLRESQLALDEEAFRTVLQDGALMQRGMPPFKMLNRDQIHKLWIYLRATAREAAQGKAGTTGL